MYIRKPNGRYRKATRSEVLEKAAEYVQEKHSIVGMAIRSPSDTATYLCQRLGNLERENFSILFLDNRHRVLSHEIMFQGSIDGTAVYPRDVIKRTLEHNAAAVILAHNHPSGIAEPSNADERITKRIKAALDLIDVRLLDHLVVAGNSTVSLANRGMI